MPIQLTWLMQILLNDEVKRQNKTPVFIPYLHRLGLTPTTNQI
ncbi:hypothetical protein SAMN04489864_102390 [Pedobacter insulae]|uniref:Uncharacterized protein n=1 Tax=Pedobacter insulae TaxID=414048 RepID=A0A1I2UWT9_9SPHI|nr:hypothetical protein SAMN04489864_102390 [Pedobacter insulae]